MSDYNDLCTALANTSLAHTAEACKSVAEMARNEDVRTPMGDGGVLEACCAVLVRATEHTHAEAIVQATRAIANLCFDHVENRKKVLAFNGAIAALARVVVYDDNEDGEDGDGTTHPTTTTPTTTTTTTAPTTATTSPPDLRARAGAGAIINVGMDNSDVIGALTDAGAVENLVWVLTRPTATPTHVLMAIRALCRFQEHKPALDRLCAGGGVEALLRCSLRMEDEEVVDDIMGLVRATLDEDARLPRLAADADGTVELLLAMRTTTTTTPTTTTPTTTTPTTNVYAQTPRQIAEKIAATSGLLLSTTLCDDAVLARFLASHDATVPAMFVTWLASGQDEDMRKAGALCVGNMCRSDAMCARVLGARDAGPASDAIAALTSLGSEDVPRLQYAALGALRNLSNYTPAKMPIAMSWTPAAALLALQSGMTHIQYQGASLLRSLFSREPDAVARYAQSDGGDVIARLVHLTGSEEERVHTEAARALANMARFGPPDVVLPALASHGVPAALTRMLVSAHVLVRLEGATALFRACETDGPFRTAAATQSNAIEVVTTQLGEASTGAGAGASAGVGEGALTVGGTDTPLPPPPVVMVPELICTVMAFGMTLLGDRAVRQTDAGQKLLSAIVALKTHENPIVATQAKTIEGALL